MCRIYLKLLAIVSIPIMVSCGPKKGIITKKKNQNERTEVLVAKTEPKLMTLNRKLSPPQNQASKKILKFLCTEQRERQNLLVQSMFT